MEGFFCIGLLDVFLHNPGFMVFRFENVDSLNNAAASGSLPVECVFKFGVFFKSWNETLFSSTGLEVLIQKLCFRRPTTKFCKDIFLVLYFN